MFSCPHLEVAPCRLILIALSVPIVVTDTPEVSVGLRRRRGNFHLHPVCRFLLAASLCRDRLDNLVSTRDARSTALRDEFLREATRPTLMGISEEAALDKNGGWNADQNLRLHLSPNALLKPCSKVINIANHLRVHDAF